MQSTPPISNLLTDGSPQSIGGGNALARNSTRRLVLATALVIYLAYCFGLSIFRAPWYDEGIFANPSYAWITTGHPGVSILDDSGALLPSKKHIPMKGVREHMYFAMPIHIVGLAGWLKMFGF